MDFLVGSVRRHLSGARNKSRSLPLYTKAGPESGADHLSGTQGDPTLSPLEKRISSSSPKLAWTSQQSSQGLDRRPQHSKRRNSSSCLPTPGQRSDSDGSPSDTTSCSSLEFLPGSSYKAPAPEQTDQACKSTSVYRRGRLEALKARVTAQRNKYKNDSSSSSSSDAEGERTPCETGRTVLPRFHSDETLHRAGRGRSSRRAKRRSQDLEALSRNPVTRSDPQLPHDNRSPVTWQESSAYLEPRRLQTDDSPSQSASEDIPSPPRKSNPLVPPQKKYSLPSTRKPLTVSVHGLVGHIPPASPCDSGLGTHSMTSSPSLGRAPTPPLRSPKPESVVHRLPPSLNSVPGSQGEGSAAVWWRKRQSLLSQLSTSRSDVASPRPGARVYAYTDQAPRPPSAYLSDSQVEPGRNHTEEFNRKLGVWKAMESTSGAARDHASNGEVSRSPGVWTENRNVTKSSDATANGGKILSDVCRSRSVIWPKDFSNGVSRSPVLENSPRNSPLAWARKDTGTPPTTIRTYTPLSAKTDMGSNAESTPKSSPVPPRLWSPPVQTRNPNRISAAEALGVTAAIPVPPTRIGSLDTARRNMDALVDKERRRRCSEHLEDALQELETIYQSLRLNEDEELLDRAERRDMPEWRPAGSRQWQKRYSIADPTGGFPLVRSYSDQASRLRRSTVPDKVADDLAVRKLQQRPSTPRNKVSPDTTSYLLCSPIYTPSLIVQPATRDVTALNEPDPEIDDVGYRKFVQGQRHQLAPHPPFGIPLEPSPQSPAGGYIHASESVHTVPDWRSSRKNVEPDLQRDDLAYRNLRRESVFLRSGSRRSVSALSDLEEWARPVPLRPTEQDDSMASIIAALEGLGGQRSPPPPVPKRRSVPGSGQKRLHGLTLRA